VAVKIEIVTPTLSRAGSGNTVTARRYARILASLGHRAKLVNRYHDGRCDLLIALHAARSSRSVLQFRRLYPESPTIVVLTGTDLYRDIKTDPRARRSLELATRLIGLQRLALAELPKEFHTKTRIIYQSAPKIGSVDRPAQYFKVAVIGQLRHEKDPLRTAYAVRQLPAISRVRVIQIGRALDRRLERRAVRENARNPRYHWLGEFPHGKTRRHLANSHLLALTSRMEGSSNALSEALASSVPVIASRIPGLIGTLGEHYPGYFPAGDTRALTRLIRRAETDLRFYKTLKANCARVKPLVSPERERSAWRRLLKELA
jgi:putative glycosyltransferase (TIGR04348 family)